MPHRRASSWLALSLWTAGALAIARVVAVIANATAGQPEGSQALELCLWRLQSEMSGLFWLALLSGGVAAGAGIWVAQRRWMALARFGLIVSVSTALFLYLLRGWTLTELPELDDPFGPFKLAGFVPLFGVALALGLLVAVSAFAIRYDTTGETPFADLPGLLLGVVLVAVAPVCIVWWARSAPPYLISYEPAHDLLAERGFEVRAENPTFPVETGRADPFEGSRGASRGRQALLMPPPAEVFFATPADEEPCVLRLSAGVDGSFPSGDERVTVRFTVAVEGEVVFTHDVALEPGMEAGPRNWRSVGSGGLVLEPGSEVVLSTRVVKPVGVKVADLPRVPAAFSELVLERERQKTRRRATDDAPNLVLIVLDSLRADRLSCSAPGRYARPLTPAIDALAARGTLYENAYADASSSEASVAALLTGLGSERHALVGSRAPLDEVLETLPEVLSRERYLTAAWVESTGVLPERGFAQGFDRFETRAHGKRMDNAVAGWIGESRDTPFFLYLHRADTRAPYRPEEEGLDLVRGRRPVDYPHPRQELIDAAARLAAGTATLDDVLTEPQRAWTVASYDAGAHAADAFVGRVTALLEELEIDRRTIVVVTSDHGEELYEHGFVQHGHDLWEELVHVPLVLAGPGIPAGRRVATPVSSRHVAPTLARRAGVTLADVGDALDLARPDALAAEPVFYAALQALRSDPRDGRPTALLGVRDGRWSAIWDPDGSVGPSALRLFDLEADPGQTLDLREGEAERALGLRERLAAHFAPLLEGMRADATSAPSGGGSAGG